MSIPRPRRRRGNLVRVSGNSNPALRRRRPSLLLLPTRVAVAVAFAAGRTDQFFGSMIGGGGIAAAFCPPLVRPRATATSSSSRSSLSLPSTDIEAEPSWGEDGNGVSATTTTSLKAGPPAVDDDRGGGIPPSFSYEYDSRGRPVDVDDEKGGGGSFHPLQTPHSGRHFRPSHPAYERRRRPSSSSSFSALRRFLGGWRRKRRFTEGWYYRLTLPDIHESFVFIFSIEDPHGTSTQKSKSNCSLCCCQIMGPDDAYMVQGDDDDRKFWAWNGGLGFGCVFDWIDGESDDDDDAEEEDRSTAMTPEEFTSKVRSGFQVLPHSLRGKIIGHDGTGGGVLQGMGIPANCDFDLTFEPLAGWGDNATTTDGTKPGKQRSAAGWLARYPVFEPHWQITMAHGIASGTVIWKNETYRVTDAPMYAEKNWGGAFPSKWYWTQCNSFDNYPDLSVTAGGGVRKLPFWGGRTETLGLIGMHHDGKFYEAVPWTGTTTWKVRPWGRWELRGRCADRGLLAGKGRPFEVAMIAECDAPGVLLRVPTKEDGMVYFARDSFYANVTLTAWHLEWDESERDFVRVEPPFIDNARSDQCGVEVGGGPWWDEWAGESEMVQPMKGMVRFPYLFQGMKDSWRERRERGARRRRRLFGRRRKRGRSEGGSETSVRVE